MKTAAKAREEAEATTSSGRTALPLLNDLVMFHRKAMLIINRKTCLVIDQYLSSCLEEKGDGPGDIMSTSDPGPSDRLDGLTLMFGLMQEAFIC